MLVYCVFWEGCYALPAKPEYVNAVYTTLYALRMGWLRRIQLITLPW
jgi:hypothetical protein